MKQLVVEVRQGLCNRLRVLMSASHLAERYGRELIVCWRADENCGARFGDLFTNPIAETDALPNHPPPLTYSPPAEVAQAVQSADPVVCLSDCHWLVTDGEERATVPYFLALRPVEAVTEAVEATAAQFRGRIVGVHVRRGDFARFLEQCYNLKLPVLERYFAYLDRWRGTIFLATDGGDEVIGPFRHRYGRRLVTYARRLAGRSTPQAVRAALVDVYLLQRCQAIVGTRFSSFSSLARCITGAPYAKVTEREVSFYSKFKFSSRILLSRMRRA